MKLTILREIYFGDIRRSVPVGIIEEVSPACRFFAQETCQAAQRDMLFADIRHNPDRSEHSLLTPVDAVCYPNRRFPWMLIFLDPQRCNEIVVVHEIMHLYQYFAQGYVTPRSLQGALPFHVKLFASLIQNIAFDLHANEQLRRRGFDLAPLREPYYQALEGHLDDLRRPAYRDDVGMQWQYGAMWGHMQAGADFYQPNDANRWVHGQLDAVCRKRSTGTIRFRDLVVDTYRRIGYDTPEKVGCIADEVTPKLFKALGERFCPEYLRTRESVVTGKWDRKRDRERFMVMKGAEA